MKIDAERTAALVHKATLGGIVTNCVLRFDEGTLRINSKDGVQVAVNAIMNGAFEPLVLPIKDSVMFVKTLKTFDGTPTLVVEGNTLVISEDAREARIVLASEEFCDGELKNELPFLSKYDGEFPVSKSMTDRTLHNMDVVKSEEIGVSVKDGVLNMTTGDSKFDRLTERASVHYKNAASVYGAPLVETLKVVDDSLRFSLNDNFPLRVVETGENYSVHYYVAPIVREEKPDDARK